MSCSLAALSCLLDEELWLFACQPGAQQVGEHAGYCLLADDRMAGVELMGDTRCRQQLDQVMTQLMLAGHLALHFGWWCWA